MSDAPEQIWVQVDLGMVGTGRWVTQGTENPFGRIEYIRADIADAKDDRIAELEGLLETTIVAVTEVQSYEQPHDPTQENALTMRELDVFDFDVSGARAILKGEQNDED